MTGAEDGGATVAANPVALYERAARLYDRLSKTAPADGNPVAERLRRSVLRPLNDALGAGTPAAAADTSCPSLLELARAATQLRAAGGASPPLIEATAALQDLACRDAEAESPEALRAALAELRGLQADLEATVGPAPDGPYLTTNVEELRDWLGCAVQARPQMALCRCGASSIKPFCDGTHAEIGFKDAKSPDRVPDRRDTYVGQQLTILDNRGICQHSGFCTDRLATVFRAREEPFVHPSGGRMDEIIRAVRDCPSGALSYAVDGVEARDEVDHHGLREPAIEITKDGPYRVTGSIPLVQSDGTPVPRDEGVSLEHYALCRCGQSQNKPFCSGMHWYVEFHDPVADPDATPSMFEWAGGLPALTRMTRLFYEKHVPADPLLAPLFADMSADHPERVARWLGEVFGGPPAYSENHGGYPRMLSQHIGKNLKEDWRRRWVELLLLSAREAGLPNDPEFRSAFQSYIEWGSRLAVENSQTNAHPPQQMPMPRWDWTTAAGPPGARISALAPPEHRPDTPIVLPGADEPLSYDKHIKQLFRAQDRNSMRFAFDLWSYDDVSAHSTAIYERIDNGSMPCDRKWPAERIAVFKRWIDAGAPH
ncbi:MAG TPA: CDGSH iron-sulfur domain-containing protein [Solirubrobacteraceae bacterium]|jgi:CDGSH-type Zn-finger protein/truncated hemoglobin YjbI